MKISNRLVGEYVLITWRDPIVHDFKNTLLSQIPNGWIDTLATWEEVGMIQAVSDGVLTLRHSITTYPPATGDNPDYGISYIPEALIERAIVLRPLEDNAQDAK